MKNTMKSLLGSLLLGNLLHSATTYNPGETRVQERYSPYSFRTKNQRQKRKAWRQSPWSKNM